MPRPPRRRVRPIVTLTSDFGLSDSYVAEMKGVLLARSPDVRIVDVTHAIAAQDVTAAAFTLERVLRAFPPGAIHIAVVDPGVGTARRLLVARIAGQTVIGPDNGLISWAAERLNVEAVAELTWRPPAAPGRTRSVAISATFHGRDLIAPAAAELANGTPARKLCRPVTEFVRLPVKPATEPGRATVIHVDHFGNCTTNLPVELLPNMPSRVTVGRRSIPLHRTYADVPIGGPLALIGSSGLLEIAVRNGNAAQALRLKVGQTVTLA